MKKNIAELEMALEAVREGEEMMRYIVRHAPNAIAIFDRHLNFLAVSDRFLIDYNITELDVIGRHFYEVIPEIPPRWREVHQRCLKGETLSSEDDYFERPDGSITYNRWECRPYRRMDGEIGGMVTYSEVTTQKKLQELALKENEKKYRYLFLNNSQPMWLFDLNKREFIEVNDAAVTRYGYTRQEFLQMTLKDISPSNEVFQLLTSIEQDKAFNHPPEVIKHIKKNGDTMYVEITPYLVKMNGVDVCQILIKDITERVLAEKALQDSETKYRNFFENSMDAILLSNPSGSILAANEAACNMLGYTEEELKQIGRDGIVDLTDPRLPLLLQERRLKGKVKSELTYIHKDGTKLAAEISTSLFVDHLGHENSNIVIRDITAQKKAQQEIKFHADLLNHIGQAAVALNNENEVIYWNKAAEKIYGWSAAEVIGTNAVTLLPTNMTPQQIENIFVGLQKGDTFSDEIIIQRKDGSQLYASVTVAPLFDTDGKMIGVIGVSIDITEKKRTEETLKKLSSAVEQTIDEVIITNKEGVIEYVNKAFENITGYTSREVVGKTPAVLKSGLYDKKFYENLWDVILSGYVFRSEIVNRNKSGNLYYVEKTISPVFDSQNNITHFVGTGVDISERKRAEEELIMAKEKAVEGDRLKSAFLANMSHEVRTPLNSIVGFSSLLLDNDFDPQEKEAFVNQIIKNGDALLSIINDIIDISKIEAGEISVRKSPVELHQFINGIYQQFTFQVKAKTLDLVLSLPDKADETYVEADPDRLSQVVINLVSNALKFTHQGHIEIGCKLADDNVTCFVKDTGIGIPAEYHEKVFDRFRQVEGERTRKYGGNGLGLAITKNLMELMGGCIWLESQPGKGSAFYFTLPRIKKSTR